MAIEKIPLVAKKNIKEVTPQLDSLVEQAKKNYGLSSLELEYDTLALANGLIDTGREDAITSIGEVIKSYVEAIANNSLSVALDEMYQEGLVEEVGSEAKLVLLYSEDSSFYTKTKLELGKIIIEIGKGKVWVNVDDAGSGIESLL